MIAGFQLKQLKTIIYLNHYISYFQLALRLLLFKVCHLILIYLRFHSCSRYRRVETLHAILFEYVNISPAREAKYDTR